ncbi:glycerol-3-phosphate 1-O-acyltransferase PlsY [Bartonella sp. B41]
MNEVEVFFRFCTWFTLLISYFIGSIPFGLLFTKFAKLGDVRTIGSGNIGATNVLRTGKKKIAALTLLCDILKGTVVVFFVKFLIYPTEIVILAGFFALLGHIFSIWLKFRGGKGVATYLGICFGFYWPAAMIFITTWIIVFLLTRYSSLSSLIAVVITPIFIYFSYPHIYAHFMLIIMSLLVVVKHSANISRLLRKKEKKIVI